MLLLNEIFAVFPEQIVCDPGVAVATGNELTVTVTGQKLPWHPPEMEVGCTV
jgi:hypothetical protein